MTTDTTSIEKIRFEPGYEFTNSVVGSNLTTIFNELAESRTTPEHFDMSDLDMYRSFPNVTWYVGPRTIEQNIDSGNEFEKKVAKSILDARNQHGDFYDLGVMINAFKWNAATGERLTRVQMALRPDTIRPFPGPELRSEIRSQIDLLSSFITKDEYEVHSLPPLDEGRNTRFIDRVKNNSPIHRIINIVSSIPID